MTTGLAYASPQPGLLHIDDAAKRLGITRRTLDRMIAAGEIASPKIAGKRWVHEQEIADFVERELSKAKKQRAERAAAAKRRSRSKGGK